MENNVHHKFSSNLCSKCGGPAPNWRCPECSNTAYVFDPEHFKKCKNGGKMQAQCQKCGEAESKCICQA